MRNALSIDVEEWYHAELIRQHLGDEPLASQVREATRPLLALLDRYQVQATFFIVGQVMADAPDVAQEIAAQGHEIGCHSMSHRMLGDLSPDAFRAELASFRDTADRLGLHHIEGFRAPTFSMDQRTSWIVPTLGQFGYRYDSSIFPLRNYMYGVTDAPLTPYPLDEDDISRPARDTDDRLWEFPMSVWQRGLLKMPVSGGFYMRMLPWPLLRALLTDINRQGRPFVIYLHPWETYAKTPRLPLPALSRWITYANSGSMMLKLERLLQRFQCGPVRQVLSDWQEKHRHQTGG